MPSQTREQRETVANLEFSRSQRIDAVLEDFIRKDHPVFICYSEGPLPFIASCAGLEGRGDSRREAEAQLAQKLTCG